MEHTRGAVEQLCLKRIDATRDINGEPVTITLERLADDSEVLDPVMLVEALAPLSAAAVYELVSALIDAGKLVRVAVAA